MMLFILTGLMLCLTGRDAQTDAPLAETAGAIRLNIETYFAGQDQVTHPAVIYFKEPWNGYRYWMTYTPYPYANGEEENPSIAVSNDLYAWVTLDGMVNPIADNEETGCRELKDPHILYRDDLDRIEIWYLGRVSQQLGGDGTSLTLFRKYSTDGIIWSDYEVMSTVEYLSPVLACLGYTYLRIQPVAARSVLALVLTSLLEGICIYCVSGSLVRAFSGGK